MFCKVYLNFDSCLVDIKSNIIQVSFSGKFGRKNFEFLRPIQYLDKSKSAYTNEELPLAAESFSLDQDYYFSLMRRVTEINSSN